MISFVISQDAHEIVSIRAQFDLLALFIIVVYLVVNIVLIQYGNYLIVNMTLKRIYANCVFQNYNSQFWPFDSRNLKSDGFTPPLGGSNT